MDELFERLAAAGIAEYGDLGLSAESFVDHLRTRSLRDEDAVKAVSLRLGDLYLACACAAGLPKAIACFETVILSHVPSIIASIDRSSSFAQEVCQVLRTKLLCGSEGIDSAIVNYKGRASLLTWVRIAAQRTALDLRRNRHDRQSQGLDDVLLEKLPAAVNHEKDYVRRQIQNELRAALIIALTNLSAEERNLLRLKYVGGLTGDEIATALGISRATVVRKQSAALLSIKAATRQILSDKLRLSIAELDSLVESACSHLELSLSLLLKDEFED